MIVLWRTTTRCNYACGFCAYDRRLGGTRREYPQAEVARFGELLATWARTRRERVLLSWLGGEPLLWQPIWHLSAQLVRAGLLISATTNGSTLHRTEVRAAVIASFAELTVSIDGPATLHDRLRGRTGAWESVRAGIRALSSERGQAPLKLRANVVLMRETAGPFADLCRTLADWGVDEITFNQLGGRDRPEFFPAQRLRLADIVSLETHLPALRHELAERSVRLCGDSRYLDRLRTSASGTPLPIDDCHPGQSFLFIDEHGTVSPCSFSGEAYGVPVASLRTIADLDALPSRFAATRAAQRLAACDDCPSTQAFAKFAA